jgi:hypothetical protein
LAPELNEVLSQSVKIINYIKAVLQIQDLLKALCDEMDSDYQNLFHSKFVGCPAVNFSRGYMDSEKKLSCFQMIKKVNCPIIVRIRNGWPG